jgi:hypothetical protein
MGTGIGIGIGIGIAGGQGLSYWRNQSEVLFFAETKNIADGKLYNQKSGATDYLTVGGSAGTYTFQCPDTAAYIAADTDKIWFKTDETPRTTTEAELIGYDFTRTIVKYEDVSDYSIQEIMILSSDLDTAKMRNDFHLSMWWDDTLSIYGYIKGNRAGEKSDWNPEAVTDSDSDAFIARMGSAPSSALAALINKTFVDLKAADIYSSLVQFTKANIHNETDAKLNWIGNTLPIVPVGSPVFTNKKGWKATTGKYLKSGFIVSDQITAGKIGADDVGFLIDSFESSGDLGDYMISGSFGSDATKRFQLDLYSNVAKKCDGYLNSNYGGTINQNDDVASADGVFYVERNNNKMIGYYNKVKSSDIDANSTVIDNNRELFFGALSTNPSSLPGYYSNGYIRTIVICKYLGATKQAALYDIIKYFNDNVGGTF